MNKNTMSLNPASNSVSNQAINPAISEVTIKTKPRRLSTIAKWINENLSIYGYEAKITEGYCNTDRKLKGTRLRHPGKGRYGNKLNIYKNNQLIFSHNAAETYRHNGEVESWLVVEIKKINSPKN